MTELQLYKFIKDNDCEWHWHDGIGYILFINCRDIEEFNKLLGSGIMDDEGIQCTMKNGYFCFEVDPLCEYFDIEIENVFLKEEEK